MSTSLLTWVLAASSTLAPAPARPHDALAEAITARVEAEPPLFRGDEDKRRTASLLVAMAFRESSLRADAVGDKVNGKPTSFCAFQIHLPYNRTTPEGWSGEDLLADPEKCVSTAMRMIRLSMKVCPDHPIAWYAAGPAGCTSERAQRISRDRLAIAQYLVRKVPVAPRDEDRKTASLPSAPGAVLAPRTD